MQGFRYVPGTVLGIRCGLYTHKGIAGDRIVKGEQTVVHNSKRLGAVAEETLSQFAGGRAIFVIDRQSALPASRILANARGKLGQSWRLFDNNCEHFVEECRGRVKRSDQVRVWVGVITLFFIVRSNA